MKVSEVIYQQLGGGRFVAMTGTKNFVSDGNTLRMTLAKNYSKANRLWITLDWDDTYTMRFFKYTPSRMKKDFTFTEPKEVDVKTFSGVYCDQLQEMFTEVTKMYTRL